jgi:adenylate cyclase
MIEVLFKYDGTLDKFVGDEIMALFGAPVSHSDDPIRAVQTAIEMRDVLSVFNQERAKQALPPIQVGMGINTGECIAGYLGSSQALDYTVIGDAVNVASRLCSVAKEGEIMISESTYNWVKDLVLVQECPPAVVKGKSKPLINYNVLGLKS